MTGEREIKVPFAEVTNIAVVCTKCGGELVADLSKSDRQHKLRAETGRFMCQLCNEEFSVRVSAALSHLEAYFREMTASGHAAFIRIRDEG